MRRSLHLSSAIVLAMLPATPITQNAESDEVATQTEAIVVTGSHTFRNRESAITICYWPLQMDTEPKVNPSIGYRSRIHG